LFFELDAVPNAGDPGTLRVFCDCREPIRAFSLSFRHDPAIFRLLLAEPGAGARSAAWKNSSMDPGAGAVTVIAAAGLGEGEERSFAADPRLELARCSFMTLAAGGGAASIEFAARAGALPLENLLVGTDGLPVRPQLDNLSTPVTEIARPAIQTIINGTGFAGSRFIVVGRHFDETDLEVRVCGKPAAFTIISSQKMIEVTAPECAAAGFAPVEICTADGCDVKSNGFLYQAAGGEWIRGDASGNGSVDIADGISMLRQLFIGEDAAPACAAALDANSDGAFDISDPIHLLSFLFLGTARLEPPYPEPAPCP
jgi:hypothetical protein